MSWEYKTVNIKFNNRWTNSEVDTEALDKAINLQSSEGWQCVSVSISTLLGYPQSALCVYKKEYES